MSQVKCNFSNFVFNHNKHTVKKILIILAVIAGFSMCKSTKNMTDKERSLIYSDSINIPFKVLLTTDASDSLFLRQKSIDIENVAEIANDKDWQHFIQRLKMTMAEESGVGIAAVQVGIQRNLFLFMRLDQPEMPVEVAINPRITAHSDEEFCFENDGCLSVPDMSGNTRRYTWIDVEYYNEKGELVKERLHGGARGGDYTGVVFQHEFDHLKGILYTDRLFE